MDVQVREMGWTHQKLEFFDRLAPYWTYEPMVKNQKLI